MPFMPTMPRGLGHRPYGGTTRCYRERGAPGVPCSLERRSQWHGKLAAASVYCPTRAPRSRLGPVRPTRAMWHRGTLF